MFESDHVCSRGHAGYSESTRADRKLRGKKTNREDKKDPTGYGIGPVYYASCGLYIGVNSNSRDGSEIQRDVRELRARVASRVQTVCAGCECREDELVQPNDGRIPGEGLSG